MSCGVLTIVSVMFVSLGLLGLDLTVMSREGCNVNTFSARLVVVVATFCKHVNSSVNNSVAKFRFVILEFSCNNGIMCRGVLIRVYE